MSNEDEPLTADQVEDAFAYNEWDVDTQVEEEPRRDRFRAWLSSEIAAAEKRGAERGWDEGADYAWRNSGEGWNGEYNSVTLNDPATFRGLHPRDPNPYRAAGFYVEGS